MNQSTLFLERKFGIKSIRDIAEHAVGNVNII